MPDALDLKGWLPSIIPIFMLAIGGAAGFVNLQASQNNLASRTADDIRTLQEADKDSRSDRGSLHAEITALDKTLAGLLIETNAEQKQVSVNTERLNALERGDRIATLEREVALLKYKLGLEGMSPSNPPPGVTGR